MILFLTFSTLLFLMHLMPKVATSGHRRALKYLHIRFWYTGGLPMVYSSTELVGGLHQAWEKQHANKSSLVCIGAKKEGSCDETRKSMLNLRKNWLSAEDQRSSPTPHWWLQTGRTGNAGLQKQPEPGTALGKYRAQIQSGNSRALDCSVLRYFLWSVSTEQ